MKSRTWLFAWIGLLLLTACNSSERAVAYNDAIVDVQIRVVEHFDAFVAAVTRQDSLGAVKSMQTALDSARTGLRTLDAMEDYKGDMQLRDAARKLVQHYVTGLERDFPRILPALVSDYATDADRIVADSIRTLFVDEETHLFALLEEAQRNFAQANGFNVTIQP